MTEPGTVAGIIAAAGEGRRLGMPVPKAFVKLGGTPLFLHSLRVFDSHPLIDSIVVATADACMAQTIEHITAYQPAKPVNVVPGGEHRWQSVHSGVLSTSAEWVLVHDAARPFVSAGALDALLEKRTEFLCAIVVTPVVDTIRTFDRDRSTGTIDRGTLARVGTPQMFHRQTLLDAFSATNVTTMPLTDEAQLIEARNIPVGLAWGDPLNFKITTPHDLELAEALLAARRGSGRS
jgi:2-C-methyl-D-erythritol 4-phosphate cytidylyltransferase